MIVELPSRILTSLHEAAGNAAPLEACGLILGEKLQDGVAVTEVVITRNVTEGNPTLEFELDPAEHIRLLRDARERGIEILGVWHSHPVTAGRPSKRDMERSTERGWLWLISGCPDGAWHTNAFFASCTDPNHFLEAELDAR